jgi:hypothetical protein
MMEQPKEYIISAKDFEQFAYQMQVVFPMMPQSIRDEWQARINRVLSRPYYVPKQNLINTVINELNRRKKLFWHDLELVRGYEEAIALLLETEK